jgi:protein required for attachment to host cells
MNKYLVVAIDASIARFLTLEPIDHLLEKSKYHLVEHKSLLNSVRELPGKELWTTTKTGRNLGAGSQAHAYDDGRENHLHEYERRFVRTVADKIIEFTQSQSIRQLVLVAEAQTLGLLRESVIPLLHSNLNTQAIAKDLCKFTATEIYKYLAGKNILPCS